MLTDLSNADMAYVRANAKYFLKGSSDHNLTEQGRVTKARPDLLPYIRDEVARREEGKVDRLAKLRVLLQETRKKAAEIEQEIRKLGATP